MPTLASGALTSIRLRWFSAAYALTTFIRGP